MNIKDCIWNGQIVLPQLFAYLSSIIQFSVCMKFIYYRKFKIYKNIEMCDCSESVQQFHHIMIFSKTMVFMLFWGSRLSPTCHTVALHFMPQIDTSLSPKCVGLSVSLLYLLTMSTKLINLVEN